MTGRFTNKVALVTGGGSGIGRACALQLAEEGAEVAVMDIDEAHAASVADKINAAGGRARPVGADVADPASVEAAVRAAVDAYGGLDVAVNNAGVGATPAPVGDLPVADWRRVLGVNLDGVFYCMRFEIPEMLRRGGGSIVNVASVMGAVASAGSAAYVASKHGVVGLTKAAALEYGARGIRVNAVGPGYMESPVGAGGRDAALQSALAELHAVHRLGQAAEIARFICFLASDEASFVTGGFHLVDGGFTAR
jgi:NAD(P)-dependent dehydrogenase (short-subunit alcohol dehydrogenase family)